MVLAAAAPAAAQSRDVDRLDEPCAAGSSSRFAPWRAAPAAPAAGRLRPASRCASREQEADLRALTGRVEEFGYQVSRLGERLDKLTADIEYRLAQGGGGRQRAPAPVVAAARCRRPDRRLRHRRRIRAGAGSSAGAGRDVSGTPAAAARHPAGGRGGRGPAARPPAAPGGAPASAAQTRASGTPRPTTFSARASTTRPRRGFSAFLTQNPQDPLAENARYWLGETYYARGDYARAAEVFVEGYQTSKTGPKAPDTLLKLGMSLSSMGKKKEACADLRGAVPRLPPAPRRRSRRRRRKRAAAPAAPEHGRYSRTRPRPFRDAEFAGGHGGAWRRSRTPGACRGGFRAAPTAWRFASWPTAGRGQRGGRVLALIVDHGLRPSSAGEADADRGWLAARGIDSAILRLAGRQAAIGDAGAGAGRALPAPRRGCLRARYPSSAGRPSSGRPGRNRDAAAGRGSGADGLAGMSGLVETGALRVVRPLLEVAEAAAARLPRSARAGRGSKIRPTPTQATPETGCAPRLPRPTAAGGLLKAGRESPPSGGEARDEARRGPARALLSAAPRGFVRLDRGDPGGGEDVGGRGAGPVAATIGGRHPPPGRQAGAVAPAACPARRRRPSLGRCRLVAAPRGRARRRRGAAPSSSSAPAAAARTQGPILRRQRDEWDGRFRPGFAPSGALAADTGLGVARFGEAGWREAMRLRPSLPARFPWQAAVTMPALCDRVGLLAVPSSRPRPNPRRAGSCASASGRGEPVRDQLLPCLRLRCHYLSG